MLPSALKVEVLHDWGAAEALRKQWLDLQRQADHPSPFCSYEWFDAWYRAYCAPENVRIIVVRDNNRVRAILPGAREQRRFGTMSLSCFVFAAEWGIPRCGIIARPDDLEAARQALMVAIFADAPTHLAIFPNVESSSLSWQVFLGEIPAPGRPRTESTYESPVYSMPMGWDAYLTNRSKEFRKRLRQSIAWGERKGEITSRVFVSGRDFDEGLERLRALEGRTWQGNIRNGVLRHGRDELFYKHLTSTPLSSFRLEIEFLLIGGIDVAFMLMVVSGNEVFLLHTGFDPSYEECRPGLIIRERIGRRLAAEGVVHFDLGAGVYEMKRRWETHRRTYGCFWLINRATLKGRLLLLEFWLWDRLKPLLRRRKEPAPQKREVCADEAKGMVSA